MWQAVPAPELDLEALEIQVTRLLGDASVAEATGAKLSRVLCAFLQGEVLPQAERAVEVGRSIADPAAASITREG
jgi:hypothetical protein